MTARVRWHTGSGAADSTLRKAARVYAERVIPRIAISMEPELNAHCGAKLILVDLFQPVL